MKNWITKKLGDCSIKFVDGDRSSRYPKRDEFVASGIPFLNAESINSGYVNLDKANFIAENKFSEIKKGRLEQNDLILTTRGNGVGKVAYFLNDKVETGLINAQLLIVRTFGDLNAKYLYYYFSSCFFQGNIKNFVSGAAQPQIPISSLKSIEISYPLPKAQQKIADILSNYDDLIENNRRRIQLLERSLHLLYKEWFVHLRFPSHEHSKIVDGIPEGWRKCQISELGNIVTGKTPSKKDSDNFNGSIPFVKTPDLHNQIFVIKTEESLSERGLKTQSSKLIPRGSIMISCIGTVGIVSIASYPCQTNQQINSVVCSDNQYSYFTFFALSRLKPLLEAMGGGATMPNVNKTKFSSIQILLPPRSLILSFQESVEASFAQIEKLSIMSEKLKQARDLLLPKLMSGAISV